MRRRRLSAVIWHAAMVTAVTLVSLSASATTAAAMPRTAAPEGCLTSSTVYDGAQPWALRRLAAQRTWPLARGYGVTVAVIGSGIDASNGQFAPGQVLPGRDLLVRKAAADNDCDGSGTFVAGLIAGRPDPATSVAGLAPDAQLLPVRVNQSVDGTTSPTDPDLLAKGISLAVGEGAKVIVVYEPTTGPSEQLSAAVRDAEAAGAVVVAGGRPATTTTDTVPDLYPCAIPEVVAVAAVDGNGAVITGSCSGPTVDLAAPGAGLVSLSAGTAGAVGHVSVADGAPGYAAGYVAGALALMMSYEPGLSGAAAAQRLGQTADRPATGQRDDQVGWGVVNPYAALSIPDVGQPGDAAPPGGTTFQRYVSTPPAQATTMMLGAASLFGVAVLVVIGVVTVRAGRQRGWHPGRRAVATTPR